MSAMEKEVMKKMYGLPPMPPIGPGSSGRRNLVRKKDYSPVHWDHYFQYMHSVKTGESNVFRVYECGTEGPVLLFLHGGGFSALSWSLLSSRMSSLVRCRCTAIDLRGHGDTVTSDDSDLSAERLSLDVKEVIESLYGDEPPPIILIGHSMGGAIAVHVASQGFIPTLLGLCVIDVVEGTAMEALSSMQTFLKTRPKSFNSLDQAIEWCVRSGQVRNLDSARVSMVGQVKRIDTNETATHEMENKDQVNSFSQHSEDCILEEEEEEGGVSPTNDAPPSPSGSASSTPHQPDPFKTPTESHCYTWRINLTKTEHFWPDATAFGTIHIRYTTPAKQMLDQLHNPVRCVKLGWFKGLSQRFLSCDVPKLLLLAGVDRLDKDLTIGQMQGKFQMQVLPQCGHAVHEDVPDKVADALATFMVRHKVAEATSDFHRSFPAC